MEEEVKYQVFTEFRGQYVIVNGEKHWVFSFPHDATLEENLAIAKELENGLVNSIKKVAEAQKEKSEKEAEKPA